MFPDSERAPEDSGLRELARRGEGAWERFIHIARRAIDDLWGRFTIPPDLRDELVQEVALRAWNRLLSAKGLVPRDDGDLPGWILLLSRDVCTDRFRRRDRDQEQGSSVGPPSGSQPPEHLQSEEVEQADALLRPIRRRPDWYRVVWLHCVEGWTFREISAEMGVPVPTLRSWYFRALATLRARLLESGISPLRSSRQQPEA
ncbi:MAG TPA: sigma-70 family RNA polymerase sigma factor [Planctomycetota bacterium]|nr:sigma-70 family RNA polymerase sigma factor [Planctomycetota bacterium]